MLEKRTPIIFVAGLNAGRAATGGHPGYVRSHALAAIAAGYAPHLVCIGHDESSRGTSFGTIHLTRPCTSSSNPWVSLNFLGASRALALRIEGIARALTPTPPGHPIIIHSFAIWGYAAALAIERLRRAGLDAVHVLSSYMVHTAEKRSQVDAASREPGLRHRLYYRLGALWGAVAIAPLERRGYLAADVVLVNYESMRRLIATDSGRSRHVRKIPYTSERAFRADDVHAVPVSLPAGEAPLIVSLSRHDSRKGLGVLLHALALLRGMQVQFRACLVGPGRMLSAHRRLAQDLGLAEAVSIPGYVPESFAHLRAASIFVLPSFAEQSGSLALLEAMQAGTPIVASACDGIPEDVTHEHDALLVPPGDVAALAEALARLLRDPELRQDLARRARETLRARFSPRALTRALACVYDTLHRDRAVDWDRAQPAPLALWALMQARVPRAKYLGIYAARNVAGTQTPSLHAEGRALDIGLDALDAEERALGDALFETFIRLEHELGLDHVIWNRCIWSAEGGGPRPYAGWSPHADHIHVAFTRKGSQLASFPALETKLGTLGHAGSAPT